ncbi:MAG: hypothetical protein J6N78_03180 [Clostridia bacterium]|nr:hypothetical protein [Clostridia bacterium]
MKFKEAFKKNKVFFIIAIILWLVITIVFIMPLTYAIFSANYKEVSFNMSVFISSIQKKFLDPFGALGLLFKHGGAGTFFFAEIIFTIIYTVFCFIGFRKSKPKHEYQDIEHGSSDWSKNGEQYQILNKKEGIILAENNYLPVDKRGNINVLVVGRIRFW